MQDKKGSRLAAFFLGTIKFFCSTDFPICAALMFICCLSVQTGLRVQTGLIAQTGMSVLQYKILYFGHFLFIFFTIPRCIVIVIIILIV